MNKFTIRVLFAALALVLLFGLLSCGGGGAATGSTVTSSNTQLALMVDSLGRAVPEADFGGGDASAAGVDGSAGDGLPIANAPVLLIDAAGHQVSTFTDAQGYYRVKVNGFTPPFIAKVTRADGTVWYSPSVSPVVTRGFVTMNITGLTDKVGGYVAEALNVGSSADLITPIQLLNSPVSLTSAKSRLNPAIAFPLSQIGINSSTFDPVSMAYQALPSNKYDNLLDALLMGKSQNTGVTGIVFTLAGSTTSGFADGVGGSAKFNQPLGFAIDGVGNFYVADELNHSVRKISQSGGVTTIGGNGVAGLTNGPASSSQFRNPTGVAVDSVGNVYVADSNNNLIRKISINGTVSTLAGTGTCTRIDGAVGVAAFCRPYSIAVGAGDDVFVSDWGNNSIRKITQSGAVSTLAGGVYGYNDGVGGAAQFRGPFGIVVDSNNNLYVSDLYNNMIRKITNISSSNSGVVSTVAGNGSIGYTDGPSLSATFRNPFGLSVDSIGNVYVADFNNQVVRKVSIFGNVSTVAGTGIAGYQNGAGLSSQFYSPKGIGVDSANNIYIVDTFNNAIRKIIQ